MNIKPYLDFDGRCQEAIEFYQKAAGAEVLVMMRYSDAPPGACGDGQFPESMQNKVMHATLKFGDSELMMSDHQGKGEPEFQGVSLSLQVDSDEAARTRFEALADGGQVEMALTSTFFASSFGTLTDRFGVKWMVMAPAPVPAG